jgi:hypothetical protein
MIKRNIFVFGLLVLALAVAAATAAQDDPEIKTGALTLASADFGQGLLQDLAATDDGLILAEGASSGRYTSGVLDAPFPFNVLVPSWSADVPDGDNLTVQIRTSKDGDRWSDWFQLVPNADWMTPEDQYIIGQMIAVPGEDVTHSHLQFSVSFARYTGRPSPLLRSLNVTFFDSTQGPTAAELAARQAEIDAQQAPSDITGYPKPSVVGRGSWCTDPACNYSDGLAYHTVSHLIVHHTVTGNSSSNWAAVVRAIWRYHTFPDTSACPGCRGWGDIGYNFLVDPSGVLYEGHLGGDDVVGTHAGYANTGSMALAFIGTYVSDGPPAPLLNSAVELFAWKADQRDIDVHGSGYLPNLSGLHPNLMGHRDVGTTQCPGDQAYALLPWLRNQVASKVDIDTIYLDELSAAFSRNNVPGWLVPPDNCGDNGHAYYAWSTQDPDATINHGEWRPNLIHGGTYELQAFIPYCITGARETDGATYTISHANGDSTVTLSQEDHVRTWMSLGTFQFAAGNSTVIKLNNLTQTDSNLGVWFDALRLVPSNTCSLPSISGLTPTNGDWRNNRNVTFSWSIADGQSIQTTRLEVASDPGFTQLVIDEQFSGEKTSHPISFQSDYNPLYWRVKVTTVCGQVVESNQARFGIDTIAPSSEVRYVLILEEDGRILPVWGGQDSGSGVDRYNIDYRPAGGPSWKPWLIDYSGNSKFFDQGGDGDYWFRSQAIDAVGNVESTSFDADAGTLDAILIHRVIMFPQIFR